MKRINKKCCVCKEFKPVSEFGRLKSAKDGLSWKCKSCRRDSDNKKYSENKDKMLAERKAWRKNNKDKVKKSHAKYYKSHKKEVKNSMLKSRYGITIDDYNNMFKEQNGKCAICDIHQVALNKSFCIDHNHETGEVRGLLCSRCNYGLGFFDDSSKNMKSAIRYLKKHKSGGQGE